MISVLKNRGKHSYTHLEKLLFPPFPMDVTELIGKNISKKKLHLIKHRYKAFLFYLFIYLIIITVFRKTIQALGL